MIRVPRDLLGAALYCVRKQAGSDSETYKRLHDLAMSPPQQRYAGLLMEDIARGSFHPGDEA